MEEDFASIPLTNATRLCVGSITAVEAANLKADGVDDNGLGYYIFLASEAEPETPIEVLGKFFSAFEANRFLRLIPA
jgi:hypothetical protein